IQHQVHADITQPGQLVTGRGQAHETIPVGQLHAIHRVGGIRVLADFVVQPGALERDAGGEIDTDADGALVQVGLAAGLAGRQAQHAHDRVAHQHDDADVWYAFVTDAFEDRVGLDPVFDQCPVAVATQRIQPGDDIGKVVFDLIVADDLAGYS